MTWFLPSYGRPNAILKLKATGLMPDDIVIVVNDDDPARDAYVATSPWPIAFCPEGSRFREAWIFVHQKYKDLPWYGALADDNVPRTRDWHRVMVDVAGSRFLAYPNGAHTEFPLMRGIFAIGGELVKALGEIMPKFLRHNYTDVVLDHICRDNNLLKPCPNIYVDHIHWKFRSDVIKDATYQRSDADAHEDRAKYLAWLGSDERRATNERVAKWKATW